MIALAIAAFAFCGCGEAKRKGGSQYSVEKIGGVPVITENGKPIRSRMLWVTNVFPNLTMEHPLYKTGVGTWHGGLFEFETPADIENATIQLDFGDETGVIAIARVEIRDAATKKLEKMYDFSKTTADALSYSCADKDGSEVSMSVQDFPDLKNKALKISIGEKKKISDLTFAIKGDAFKKGKRYAIGIVAKTDRERPLTIVLFDKDGGSYTHVAPTFEAAAKQIKLAASAGVDMVTFKVSNFWDSDGRAPNYDDIDAVFRSILRVNPKAKLVPRPALNPQLYKWWRDIHPDLIMKNSDGSLNNTYVSMSSETYRKQGVDTLRSYIKYCEKNYAQHMAGYHPAGANSSEWFYGDTWRGRFSGYDTSTITAWRKWLEKKYNDVANLEKAWSKTGIGAFDKIEIPSPAEREEPAALIDPAKYRQILDFNIFLQDEMTDTVLTFARAVRETAGDGRLCLFFYGYAFEFSSVRNGPAFSGHYGLGKLLKSKDIDILCGPISYNDRDFGDAKSTMGATESITDSGKIWFDEDDTRTYLSPKGERFYAGANVKIFTQKDNIEVFRRNLAQEIIRNNGVWWMDLNGESWFGDPAFWDLMKGVGKIERDLFRNPVPYRPEVRFVIDEISLDAVGAKGAASLTTSQILGKSRASMNRAGVPFGHYLLEDIIARKDCGKLNIYLAAYALNAKQREAIKEIAKNSASIFAWMPGYIDLDEKRFSTEAVKDLTGFEVKPAPANIAPISTPTEEGKKIGLKEAFGVKTPTMLLVPKVENGDVVLATFSDGSPSVVLRTRGGHARLFCATTSIPTEIFRHMAKLSGAHMYADNDAVVYANGAYLSLTATRDGECTVDFGTDKEIFNAISGNSIGKGPVMKFDLKKGDNKFFKIGAGASDLKR